MSACFEDPNGGVLSYHATTSDAGIATVSVSGSSVTVTGVSPGRSVVTVTATDPTELAGDQQFVVLVPNRAPVAVGEIESRELPVGESASLDVSAHFREPDGQSLSYATSVSDAGVLDISVAGSVVTFGARAKGFATVTATASDPGGLSAMQSFVVTVPNRTPAAVDSIPTQTVEVDASATTDVSPYFTDPDGDDLAYTATTSDASVAEVSVSGATVTVEALAKGAATVTVTATDTEGLTATQEFLVTVPNRPPLVTGAIEGPTIEVDETVAIELSGHFTDPDGDDLAYGAATSDEAVAGVEVGGGALTVTAVAKGAATVTVTATDTEGLTATQEFSVTVPNRPPLATGPIEGRTIEVGEAETLTLSGHFSDPDGDDLVYSAATADAAVAGAAVTGGAVIVTAVAKGETTVTVTAADTEDLTATQEFVVTVPNRPPAAVGWIREQTFEIGESATLALSGYFEDPDGDDLVYSVSSSGPTLVGASAEGATVTVEALAKGAATVTVTATDTEGLTATQEFLVTVPNRPPLVAGAIEGPTIEVDETVAIELSGHFTDPDGDDLAYGAATSDEAVAGVEVGGGALTVTAVAKGAATVTVTATDTEGLTATQEFSVTVPNRPPLATGPIEGQTIEVGEAETLTLSGHFSDPDGDDLVYFAATADAAVAGAAVTGGAVIVTAVAKGETTVTVTAADTEDLTATQEFVVTVPNRPPAAVGSIREQTFEIGESATLALSGYFEDPDGDDLVYSVSSSGPTLVGASAEGATVTVEALAKGAATVTVTATDTEGLTATQEFLVTVPNRPPLVAGAIEGPTIEVDETVAIELSGHFTDPDGDDLAYGAATSDEAVAGVEAGGGVLTVTAVAKGAATVTVTATDTEGLTAKQEFSVTVPNRPPQRVGALSDMKVATGGIKRVDPASRFADPDGDTLVFHATSSDPTVAKAWMAVNGVVVRGVKKGTATVTITAADPEELTAAQQFSVEVTASNGSGSNRPPFTTGTIAAQTVAEGQSRTLDASGFFSDPDGDKLEFSARSSSTGVVTVAVSLSRVEVHAAAVGTATVTITARDPDGLGAALGFTVTVTEVTELNRPPYTVGSFSPQTLDVAETKRFSAASHFRDPDGDDLRFSAQSSDNGVVTATVSGSEVALAAAAEGSATVVLTAADPDGLTATADFDVTVTEGGGDNRPPVVLDEVAAQDLEVGEAVTVTATALFSDPDFDELTFSAESSDTEVVEAKVSGSAFEFDAVDEGNAMVTVTAEDPEGLSASQEFGVAVVREIPNRPPVLVYDNGEDLLVVLYPGETVVSSEPLTLFSDPDEDELTPSAHSSDAAIVETEIRSDGAWIMTGVDLGEADVTLTARDPDGASASQIFKVTVEHPNKGPVPVDTMPDLTLEVGESVAVDVEPYFEDPEGDKLDYILRPRDDDSRTIARPTAYGVDGVTVTAFTCGTASFEARATDGRFRSAHQFFDVVVPQRESNQDPELAPGEPLYPIGLLVGNSRTLKLTGRSFRDPDPDDVLSYEAVPSDGTIVGVEGTPASVTLEGLAPGNTTVEITARDGCGGSTGPHSLPVIVRNENLGPTVNSGITWEPFFIDVGDTVSFDLNSMFSDPEGDPLTFAGLTAPSTALDYALSSGVMKVWGVGAGAASMSATAFDPFGKLVELPWISVLVTDPNEDTEQLAQGRGPGGSGGDPARTDRSDLARDAAGSAFSRWPHLAVEEYDRKGVGIRHEELGRPGRQ